MTTESDSIKSLQSASLDVDVDDAIITISGSLVPRPIFPNINGGRKNNVQVLIVYGRVGCDRKFNSKTFRKTVVKFNENTDK